MLRLTSLITLTDSENGKELQLPWANEIEIEKSRRALTVIAKVTIARRMVIKQGKGIFNPDLIFKRGVKVKIELGYDDNLVTEFEGYISEVDAKIPFVFKCQDEMWKLKQNSFSKSWKNVKVADVIKYIYSGPQQVVDLELGGLVIKNQSTAQVLDDISRFGLQCYFDNGVLIVDFAGVLHSSGEDIIYDFYKNIITSELGYKTKEDFKVKVRGVSKQPNGKKIEITVGDNDGEEHTLHYYNLTQSELQKIVNAEINNLKHDGYKGYFITFGLPLAIPGDKAMIRDMEYPERDGSYLIESVKTTFGVKGFRREIQLERKLS